MSGNNRGRRNWTLSMTGAVLVAAAAAVIGGMAGGDTEATERHYFKSSAGAVLFDHGTHSGTVDSCATCHHELYGAAQATSCSECHDDGVESADYEHGELKEIHSRDCSKCHAVVKEEAEIASCRACHPGVQASEARTVGCSACHDDSYSPDMLEHDEFLEIEDHSCLGCHTPGSVSETYHTNCTGCHVAVAPERFANEDGGVLCSSCHLR